MGRPALAARSDAPYNESTPAILELLVSLRFRRLAVLALAALTVAVPAARAVPHDAEAFDVQAGPEQGHVPARHAGGALKGASSPLLVFHGGTVMTTSSVTAIFWGTKFASPSYTGDVITGLDGFYGGIGGSTYLGTNTEFSGRNGQVGNASSYAGHLVDTGSSLVRKPSRTTDILTEVAKLVQTPVANGYYPVYTDLKRGTAGYCAWHSWGSINGVPVQFGFFFDLAGDPGCDPQDPATLHSQPLEALANVSGHELSEALTDPRGDGWYDSAGAENADKCAWTFGSSPLTFGGSSWKIQGNFSNAAFTAHAGYNAAGCIDR
jgi:hypothetical protein